MFNDVEFLLSTASVEGEGEVKVIREILTRASSTTNYDRAQQSSSGNFLIYGQDSDLILLALLCHADVYLLGDKQSAQMFSTRAFNDVIARQLHGTLAAPSLNLALTRVDFGLLALLRGNDYLPRMRHLKHNMLWPKYLKMRDEPRYANAQVCRLLVRRFFVLMAT